MSEIAVCKNYTPPQDWSCIARFGMWSLFLLDDGDDYIAEYREYNHHGEDENACVCALMGYNRNFELLSCWAQHQAVNELSRSIGACTAGVVMTNEGVTIFRDKIGVIPLVIFGANKDCTVITSSLSLLDGLVKGASLNLEWVARYINHEDSDSTDDYYEGVERIRPGELVRWRSVNHNVMERHDYWPEPDFFEPLEPKDFDEATLLLRDAMIDAMKRVPNDKPFVYTMSGGLDSTGMIGITHKLYPDHDVFRAMSFVSGKYASCDETQEIDLMAREFGVELTKIDLSEAPTFSRLECYAPRAFGPKLSMGLEPMLLLCDKVRSKYPGARLMTGFGGNGLVYVPGDALWVDLIERRDWRGLLDEFRHAPRELWGMQCRRVAANVADGKLRNYLKRHLPAPVRDKVFASIEAVDALGMWRRPALASREKHAAFMFGANLATARLLDLRSWSNEIRMRIMYEELKQTHVSCYDPLYDPELFTIAARLPARYYLYNSCYRPLYRAALAPFLPKAIIDHPKCQNFNATSREAFVGDKRDFVKQCIANAQSQSESSGLANFIDFDKLALTYDKYCTYYHSGKNIPAMASMALWRAISLCLPK